MTTATARSEALASLIQTRVLTDRVKCVRLYLHKEWGALQEKNPDFRILKSFIMAGNHICPMLQREKLSTSTSGERKPTLCFKESNYVF